MRKILAGSVAAAALGTVMMMASALPASAQVARPQLAAGGSASGDLLTLVGTNTDRLGGPNSRDSSRSSARSSRSDSRSGSRWSGNSRWSGGGSRWSGGGSRWSNNRYYRRDRGGIGVGFAAGALIGSAIASQPYYAQPYAYMGDDAVSYCMNRYQSYDPRSGTYLGYDGYRHPCP